MVYTASNLSISKVENGFLIHVHTAGSTITLVAPSETVMLQLIGDLNWETPRPLSSPIDQVPQQALSSVHTRPY